jgi:hypothetical protein
MSQLPQHINNAADLVTAKQTTKEGFISQALAKADKAQPYIEDARQFWLGLQQVESLEKLGEITQYRQYLIAAAGLSTKAVGHMSEQEISEAINRVLAALEQKAAVDNQFDFRQDLVYRYLLTKGDTLGGVIRNYIGALGAQRFTNAVVEALRSSNVEVSVQPVKGTENVRSVVWSNRVLLFNRTPKFLKKNIDVILLNTSIDNSIPNLLETPTAYKAVGELKGGIDPAGADEHWKTAKSAFKTVRDGFTELSATAPPLFFVGASVEVVMANEIFNQLQDGSLAYAANLTVPEQLQDLANWLITL